MHPSHRTQTAIEGGWDEADTDKIIASLNEKVVEDDIYDSYIMRKFMSVDFYEHKVSDATTLCKFRKILTDNKIDKLFADTCNNFLEKHGYMMHGGTIVDATIITATSYTKYGIGKIYNRTHL